jgi:hypothetical protein
MPSGGRRPGAGRKPGSISSKTLIRLEYRKKAAEAAAEQCDIMPLEVIMRRMRELWVRGDEESKRESCMLAQAAAPYLHPRLQTINQNLSGDGLVINILKFSELETAKTIEAEATEHVH